VISRPAFGAQTCLSGVVSSSEACRGSVCLYCSCIIQNEAQCKQLLTLRRAPETHKIISSYPAIIDYAKRIHDRYFDDYALWDDKDVQDEGKTS
jgi:hypothetical protein